CAPRNTSPSSVATGAAVWPAASRAASADSAIHASPIAARIVSAAGSVTRTTDDSGTTPDEGRGTRDEGRGTDTITNPTRPALRSPANENTDHVSRMLLQM